MISWPNLYAASKKGCQTGNRLNEPGIKMIEGFDIINCYNCIQRFWVHESSNTLRQAAVLWRLDASVLTHEGVVTFIKSMRTKQ